MALAAQFRQSQGAVSSAAPCEVYPTVPVTDVDRGIQPQRWIARLCRERGVAIVASLAHPGSSAVGSTGPQQTADNLVRGVRDAPRAVVETIGWPTS
jgi:hypothetical protein